MVVREFDSGLCFECLFTHLFISFTVVADYVPRGLQVPARFGVVGLTGIMGLGLLKLSLMGPGIGGE